MKIFDISQTLREDIAVWPGDCPFTRRWTMRLVRGDSCNTSAVTLSVHTGTHLDAPHHVSDSGPDIGSVSLDHYMGPARIVDLPADSRITVRALESFDWNGVARVLFKTRASGVPEGQLDPDYPHLSEDGAHYLASLGLVLVGTDAPSVDAFDSNDLPAHRILLSRNVAILEGARLGEVTAGDYELICLPLRLAGLDGSPVRAVLRRP
jgi:arylformamidase